MVLCENALSQNYVQTSPLSNGTDEYYPFRVDYSDARSEISYENINFRADTIFSIGFNIEDRGSSYEHAYQVMYNFEINFRENSGAWQTVYTGNFAPVQGEWNDIFLDIPYIKQFSNDLEVSICFNNCERNPITILGDIVTFFTVIDDVGPGGNPRLGDTYYKRSGTTYSSQNSECTPPTFSTLYYSYDVPWTRFGYGNVNRKTVNVCSSNDSITIFGTSSLLPDLSTIDINNDGLNDFNGPYPFNNGNFISYHYRSRGTQFSNLYWINADYVCQSIGAHLSHIETRVENNFILNNVHSNHDRWIGAYQNCNSSSFSEPSGGWQWTNGNPVSTNYNVNSWRSSAVVIEPNNDNNNEHYAMMYSANNPEAGKWNDQPVTRSARFLMEVEDIYVWSTGDTTKTAELTIANTNSLSNSIIWMERLVEESGRTFKKREYFTFNTVSGPSVSVTSSPSNKVCEGSSILLQATGADNYRWNHGPLTATDSVSPTMPTTYTVVGTDNNGCENTASVSIAVNALPTVAAGSSSPTNEVCIGDSIQIQAVGALTYSWDNGAVLANDSVSPLTNTTYTVIGTDVNGCENTASVSVAVNALPNVQIANASAVCLGNSVSLQANGALSYLWGNNSVASTITVTPTLTQSTYSVTGTDINGCENTDSINVIVNQLPSTGPIFHN